MCRKIAECVDCTINNFAMGQMVTTRRDFWAGLVIYLKQKDERRLYTSTAGWSTLRS